jgi:hypothetical protein
MGDAAPTAKGDRVAEIIEVIVLSLVAILTAWSGYQGTKWGGQQAIQYATASSDRLKAEALSTHAGQVLVADATFFTAWLQAHEAGDTTLEAQLEKRFSPEYEAAFQDWLGTDPFTDPDAPPGPAAMPGFTTAEFEQAAALNTQASEELNEGTTNRETANQYVRGTVLFASVLFLVAIAQRFKIRRIRFAANGLAVLLLLYSIGVVISLPRI